MTGRDRFFAAFTAVVWLPAMSNTQLALEPVVAAEMATAAQTPAAADSESGAAKEGSDQLSPPKLYVPGNCLWSPTGLGFSADGRQVHTSYETLRVIHWSAATGRPLRTFLSNSRTTTCFAMSPDGRHVLLSPDDKSVVLWEASTGKRLWESRIPFSEVMSVSFTPEGEHVLTVCAGDTIDPATGDSKDAGAIVVTNRVTGKSLRTFEVRGCCPYCAALAPDGRKLVCGASHVEIRIGAESESLSVSVTGKLVLWDMATGKQLRTFPVHTGDVQSVSFSPNGRQVLSGGSDETAVLWDVGTGKKLKVLRTEQDVYCVAFSPDGKHVFTGGGAMFHQPEGKMGIFSGPGEAILWDVATGKKVQTFPGHLAIVRHVGFSPDGKRIATVSSWGRVRIWEAATGRQLVELTPFSTRYQDFEWLAVTPEGYFDCSRGARKLATWVVNSIRVPLEQQQKFDRKYYRPDLVARALGGLRNEEQSGNDAHQAPER